jgi:hypothetical protein
MGSNHGFYQSLMRAVPETCQGTSLTQRPHGTRPALERVGFGFLSPLRDIGRLLGVSHQVNPGPRQGPLTAHPAGSMTTCVGMTLHLAPLDGLN